MSVHHYTKKEIAGKTYYECERCGDILDANGNQVERTTS